MNRVRPISPQVYDREYFLRHRGGSGEFTRSQGKELYDIHRFALQIAELKPTYRVLDAGCGCGEIALNAAQVAESVLAIDYSQDAIDLAISARQNFADEVQHKVTFVCTSLDSFQYHPNHYDVIFFLDVIEHLTPRQIKRILHLLYSALKTEGKLIVHTWPNRWHRQITYPITYYGGKISNKYRPKDPRTYHESIMHVTEQSPLSLKRTLKNAGFRSKVFLNDVRRSDHSSLRLLYTLTHNVPPFKWFYCDYIWGIGVK